MAGRWRCPHEAVVPSHPLNGDWTASPHSPLSLEGTHRASQDQPGIFIPIVSALQRPCPQTQAPPATAQALTSLASLPPAGAQEVTLPQVLQHPDPLVLPACHLPGTRSHMRSYRKFTQGARGLTIYNLRSSLILKSCHPQTYLSSHTC